MRQIKQYANIVGFDDSPFDKLRDKEVLVVGTVMRGLQSINGFMTTKVKIDGADSTSKLISLISKSKFRTQLKAVLLDGIAFGGFNVIDIKKLSRTFSIPVIVIIRRKPDIDLIIKTLIKIKKKSSITLIDNAGTPAKLGKIYVQYAGCSLKQVKDILRISTSNAEIPEPLRISHLIAAAMIKGESSGDA